MCINSPFEFLSVNIPKLKPARNRANKQVVFVDLIHVSRAGLCRNFFLYLARPGLDIHITDQNHRVREIRHSEHSG